MRYAFVALLIAGLAGLGFYLSRSPEAPAPEVAAPAASEPEQTTENKASDAAPETKQSKADKGTQLPQVEAAEEVPAESKSDREIAKTAESAAVPAEPQPAAEQNPEQVLSDSQSATTSAATSSGDDAKAEQGASVPQEDGPPAVPAETTAKSELPSQPTADSEADVASAEAPGTSEETSEQHVKEEKAEEPPLEADPSPATEASEGQTANRRASEAEAESKRQVQDAEEASQSTPVAPPPAPAVEDWEQAAAATVPSYSSDLEGTQTVDEVAAEVPADREEVAVAAVPASESKSKTAVTESQASPEAPDVQGWEETAAATEPSYPSQPEEETARRQEAEIGAPAEGQGAETEAPAVQSWEEAAAATDPVYASDDRAEAVQDQSASAESNATHQEAAPSSDAQAEGEQASRTTDGSSGASESQATEISEAAIGEDNPKPQEEAQAPAQGVGEAATKTEQTQTASLAPSAEAEASVNQQHSDTEAPDAASEDDTPTDEGHSQTADAEMEDATLQVATRPVETATEAVNETESEPATESPTFDIVRVEPDGSAVIAGRAPPESKVVLRDDQGTIGEAEADFDGNWVLIPDRPLKPGSRILQLVAYTGDGKRWEAHDDLVIFVPNPAEAAVAESGKAEEGGRASPDQPLVVLAPKAESSQSPTKVLQAPGRTQLASGALRILAVDYDLEGKMRISGQAPAEGLIQIYLDNALFGRQQADAAGQWVFAPDTAIAPGLHRLRADLINAEGKVLARVETPFARVAPLSVPDNEDFVVVQPGNSLWVIARRSYGRGILYHAIYAANEGQIRDADLIYPGQVFLLPDLDKG